MCVHFIPRERFDFGNFSGYCCESEKWGAFEASRIVRVLEVDCEAKEIVRCKRLMTPCGLIGISTIRSRPMPKGMLSGSTFFGGTWA